MAKMLWYLLHKQSPQHRKEVRITMRNFHSSTHPLRRTTALAMCAVLLLGSIPAFAVDDGVKPTYDEAYYAMTDYYGNLTDGSVVKSYTTNGAESLTDYGDYDEIVNLTNGLVPTTAAGKAVFQFAKDAIPDHFYFEGKTAKPFAQLPWTLAVHYTLNGVPTKAEDLAGKTGVVEISIDAIPNENASEYARNNYTLEAMAVFNQDDILSLEAPGAQVQLVGNLRAVLFIGLPGEECHFTIRVGSDDFSFGGMTFLMVPATLSQLEEISKLSERKDDLEDNYNKLSSSLDVLLDSMSGISGSLYATANGLDQLDTARGTISDGKAELYEKADAVRGDLDAVSAALEPVSGEIDAASAAITDGKAELGKLNETVTSLRTELKELDSLIDDLQDHEGDFDDLFSRLSTLSRDLRQLQTALNSAKNTSVSAIDPLFGGMTGEQLSEALKQVNGLRTVYTSLGGTDTTGLSKDNFVQYALKKSSETNSSITDEYIQAVINGYRRYNTCTTQEEVMAKAAAAEGIAEDQIAAYIEREVSLWGTYVTIVGKYFTPAVGSADSMDFRAFLCANLLLLGKSQETAEVESASLYKLYQLNKADPNLTQVLILEADDLNAKVNELNGVIGKTNQLVKGIAAPTADLAGTLARLCDDLEDLNDIVSIADDFGDLGRSTAKKCITILDETDALYKVLDAYEPKLQESLTTVKTLSEAAGKTVSDTSDFLSSLESLAKTSGTQLDAGTKQTLEGLAAALRATARSLNTTGDVKSAKNNIGDIIEDTWNEYTGDVNNLLLMDANAEAVSLTDTRNDSPQSIQVLIRTKEIKKDDGAKAEIEVETAAQTTFWGRVAQMFRDFWAAITGIFKGKD